jgi:ribonuclease G
MTKDLIVCTTPQETKVALLEDGVVSELFIEREAHRGVAGNIYKGRVTRVLPGMQSAFVDAGLERDAFLYVADVLADLPENLLDEPEPAAAEGEAAAGSGNGAAGSPAPPVPRDAPIEERLHEGQEVVVQVVKEPLGTKGARITTHVSLPGRYLVFMPTVEHVGVSRKITDDEERRRLKGLLKEIRQERGGGGFIARTAGAGAEREEFIRDARYLTRTWDEVRAQASRQPAPALLHRELGLVQRLLRDLLSADVASIRLDHPKEYQRTLDLVNELQPALAPRVKLHDAPTPIMEEHGVSTELERALRSKVWLESGGYIVINQTEALVAIDVNTGRYTGKKALEDTIPRPTSRPRRRSCARSACATSAASSWWTSSTWRSARAGRR